ncbi:hypothetical protein Pth03_53460 [Planotetraspora thailandica]|uniref:Uncharacterized protein n=1 Tax=Planotetraspora thailandica TaxID=487172 RepID=A0A8J3V3Y1_9ACTN|nr:substrate-binding domain-containing protein [Planotetraspora thailandica]GII56957.1 hypothetical protein Pth03_53460 [Planotetraspora thailandica]
MRKSSGIAAVLAATAATALVLAAGTPAMADPAAGTYPPIAGVGSGTTQDVLNALADPMTGSLTNVGSWDATGSSQIRVTATGPSFSRPISLSALGRSIDGNPWNGVVIRGQLDFARSSRGPAAGTDLGAFGALTFIPMARDGMAYAYNGAGLSTSDQTKLSKLSRAQLQGIYSAPTAAAAKAAAGNVDVVPFLPPYGSDMRFFFIGALGLTEGTLGAYVLTTPQENKADGIVDSTGEIVPFSAASWIAQRNHVAPTRIDLAYAAGTRLGSPVVDVLGDPVSPTLTVPVTPPTTPATTKLVPNPDYYSNAWFGHDVYNVVETARITVGNAKYDSALASMFAGPSSQIASADSDAIIAKYGFQFVSYAGDTDIVGSGEIGGVVGSGDHAKSGVLEWS